MKSTLTRFLAIIALGTVIVLMVLLTSVSTRPTEFERSFAWLAAANVIVAVILLACVASFIWRLVKQLRAKTYGAQTFLLLTGLFTIVGVAPCVLIFATSSHLVSQAFHAGLDSRVEESLGAGADLSRELLLKIQKEDLDIAEDLAKLVDKNGRIDPKAIPEGVTVEVFDSKGQAVGAQAKEDAALIFAPEKRMLEAANENGRWVGLSGDPLDTENQESETPLYIEALVPTGTHYLFLTHAVPSEIAEPITRSVRGLRDYQESVFVRSGMQGIYHWSLILTVVMTALGSILAAFLFSGKILQPLRQLQAGTRQAFGGKLQTIREFSGSDEINELTRAFNTMIRRINDVYEKLDARRISLEQTNIFLERILGNLSTAVIVLDSQRRVRIANEAAIELLGQPLSRSGVPLAESLPRLARLVLPMLSEENAVRHEGVQYESVEKSDAMTLFLQTTPVPLEKGIGFIVMANDMTQAVAAQRAIAWGEVARRLAHEIKNPLTPIQLAAERIQFKLSNVLDEENRKLLDRHTKTIVEQVSIMNTMVRDFRDYAKLPKPKFLEIDLNEVIEEISRFYEHADFVIRLHLETDPPKIRADKAQLLQVLHNLLSNAREAAREGSVCHVDITTQTQEQGLLLTIVDDGIGFQQSIMDKAFEPYITTKPTGTGLGLPMVKKISDEHEAKLSISNDPETHGACVKILFTLLAGQSSKVNEERNHE